MLNKQVKSTLARVEVPLNLSKGRNPFFDADSGLKRKINEARSHSRIQTEAFESTDYKAYELPYINLTEQKRNKLKLIAERNTVGLAVT